jgi:hypothetical protein
MATKTKGTNAKIKELKGIKPEKISETHLKQMQDTVNKINQSQLEVGNLESRKHAILHYLAGVNDELTKLRTEFEKDYGTDDIDIKDGTINYREDVEADKED